MLGMKYRYEKIDDNTLKLGLTRNATLAAVALNVLPFVFLAVASQTVKKKYVDEPLVNDPLVTDDTSPDTN